MAFNFFDLAVPGVQGLKSWSPPKSLKTVKQEYGIQSIVKLAFNENPLGADPLVVETIREKCGSKTLADYPEVGGPELRRALASYHNVEEKTIILGNGSSEVLDLIVRTFVGPSHTVIFSEHAFITYFLASQTVGAQIIITPAKNYGHDLEAMSSAVTDNTRMIFVANPNNPTGTWVDNDKLKVFMDKVPENVLVVVDEAYSEYGKDPAYPDCIQWLPDYPNLIVTRTFSKAYGLAGLRIGYAVSHPDVADLLNRVCNPFCVNSLALLAAQVALKNPEHLAKGVRANRIGMAQLIAEFELMGLSYIPSLGNFICVDTKQPGVTVYENLMRKGIIVSPVVNYGLPTHLRVTVGLQRENNQFIQVFKKVLQDF